MKITGKWLEEKSACGEGVNWFESQDKTEAVDVLNSLIKDKKLEWANWLIVRVMTRVRSIWPMPFMRLNR